MFDHTSLKTTVLYNGPVKGKSLKLRFNQSKNAPNLRDNVPKNVAEFIYIYIYIVVIMSHHSGSIHWNLLSNVIENTQRVHIVKGPINEIFLSIIQNDHDTSVGFDGGVGQCKQLKISSGFKGTICDPNGNKRVT